MNTIFKAPISKLRLHHRAEEIPTMDPDQYDNLVDDIKIRGIQVPLDVLPMQDVAGRSAPRPDDAAEIVVLDGRHRLRAATALGIEEIEVREVQAAFEHHPDDDELCAIEDCEAHQLEYMVKAATMRRHLTTGQRKELAAKLLAIEPQLSDRYVAREMHISPTTVGNVRRQAEEAGDVSRLDTRTDSTGREQPASKTDTKRLTIPSRFGAAPPWKGQFTVWVRRSLPEQRKWLVEMDEKIHEALAVIDREDR